jgi:hypothetical protein
MGQLPPTEYPPLPSGNDPAVLLHLPRWNWGACLLQWIWTLGHGLYFATVLTSAANLLGLGLFSGIILGTIGNELAWKYRPFADLDEFRRIQSAWTRAGIIVLVVTVVLVLVGAVCYLMAVQSIVREMGRMTSGMTQ